MHAYPEGGVDVVVGHPASSLVVPQSWVPGARAGSVMAAGSVVTAESLVVDVAREALPDEHAAAATRTNRTGSATIPTIRRARIRRVRQPLLPSPKFAGSHSIDFNLSRVKPHACTFRQHTTYDLPRVTGSRVRGEGVAKHPDFTSVDDLRANSDRRRMAAPDAGTLAQSPNA